MEKIISFLIPFYSIYGLLLAFAWLSCLDSDGPFNNERGYKFLAKCTLYLPIAPLWVVVGILHACYVYAYPKKKKEAKW